MESWRKSAGYIDGKQIKGIQEIRVRKIRVRRPFIYRFAKLIRTKVLAFMVKHRGKGR